MQKTFKIPDGEMQKTKELDILLQNGWRVISTSTIDYGRTTLFILEKGK